jgi:hypothetical protein
LKFNGAPARTAGALRSEKACGPVTDEASA